MTKRIPRLMFGPRPHAFDVLYPACAFQYIITYLEYQTHIGNYNYSIDCATLPQMDTCSLLPCIYIFATGTILFDHCYYATIYTTLPPLLY